MKILTVRQGHKINKNEKLKTWNNRHNGNADVVLLTSRT